MLIGRDWDEQIAAEADNLAVSNESNFCSRDSEEKHENAYMLEKTSGGRNEIILNSDSTLLKMNGIINRIELVCVLDTGAAISVLSERAAKRHKVRIKNEQEAVRSANGSLTYASYTQPLSVIIQGRHCMVSFVVIPNDIDVIMGMDWMDWHNIETISLQQILVEGESTDESSATDFFEENFDGVLDERDG